MSGNPKFAVGTVTRFYVPLLMQAFSQSLTYPLVAGIVTHGEHGVNTLTAFVQGQMIMFMIGALGGGLITTGLVFAKTLYGYVSFKRLNLYMMAALLLLQCVPAIQPLSKWIFEYGFGLPHEMAEIARWTLLFGTIMNAGFFLRNVPIVVLFNNLESAKANNATIARILVTLACAVVFPLCGLSGAGWGLFALTLGVWVELLITWLYARPYVRALSGPTSMVPAVPTHHEIVSLVIEQFRFTLPLAFGGFLLYTSPLIIAAYLGRTESAADMLAIHYVTLGVANPVSYAALRLQTVSVKFMPEFDGDRRLLYYAIVAGAILGLIPLAMSTEWLGRLYFGGYQNVPDRILGVTRLAIGIYSFIPIIHAVRGRIEGIAAARKCSGSVMAGQVSYTIALLVVCSILLPLGVDGWIMAISAIFVAPVCTICAVYCSLLRSSRKSDMV